MVSKGEQISTENETLGAPDGKQSPTHFTSFFLTRCFTFTSVYGKTIHSLRPGSDAELFVS